MWLYNAKTRTTDSEKETSLIPRVRIEEAAEVLYEHGFRNQSLIVDVLAALSGMGRGEIRFNVEFVFQFAALMELEDDS